MDAEARSEITPYARNLISQNSHSPIFSNEIVQRDTENVVFLELLRRDYHVSIGKIRETVVDFIAEKQDEKLYIQVTETMSKESTHQRELRPLQLISDNYEK